MATPGQQQLFSRLTKSQILSCDDDTRFAIELEFVQSLANPQYLNWLAQNRYLDDQAFVNYLKYLLYWKEPKYIVYIKYPHCLHFLDLLQTQEFRTAIANNAVADTVFKQQFFFWRHFRRNRVKELLGPDAEDAPGPENAAVVKQEPQDEPSGTVKTGPEDMAVG